jgi:hypothetical protein
MLKYVRIAVTALSLMACGLLVALWVRSYFVFDRLSGEVAGRTSVIMVSYAGRLSAVAMERSYLRWNWPQWDSGPILPNNSTFPPAGNQPVTWDDTDVVWPTRAKMGFGWIHRSLYLNIPNRGSGWSPLGMSGRSWGTSCTGSMVPHWFPVAILAAIGATPWIRWSKRFSLRTLLVATTLVAVGLGIAAMSR